MFSPNESQELLVIHNAILVEVHLLDDLLLKSEGDTAGPHRVPVQDGSEALHRDPAVLRQSKRSSNVLQTRKNTLFSNPPFFRQPPCRTCRRLVASPRAGWWSGSHPPVCTWEVQAFGRRITRKIIRFQKLTNFPCDPVYSVINSVSASL